MTGQKKQQIQMDCLFCSIIYLFVNGKSTDCTGIDYGSINEGF